VRVIADGIAAGARRVGVEEFAAASNGHASQEAEPEPAAQAEEAAAGPEPEAEPADSEAPREPEPPAVEPTPGEQEPRE
jgi:hypothetical protein